ncbi:MAG: NAD+ synthase [Anaerolineae bacterium]|nr:NAD+ synthase [Anaerolineae bacterium]
MLATQIAQWMAERVRAAGARGIVVGLSGGVDSSVVAVLAQRAVGENVLGVLMPCHSQPVDGEYARLLADAFSIETVTVDLGPAYDALIAALPPGSELAQANLKPRLRMATLYFLANARNYLVAGTGNKSELMVGYFTKWGDGGCDLLPLGGLYKTHVWDLACELGIPEEIISRPPTAGLWPGQTDEGEMGITYAELDATLAAIERGDTSSCNPATLAKVQAMVERSAHKRALPPIFTPTQL